MKGLLVSLSLLLFAARTEASDHHWTRTDTALEVSYIALETMDLLTTSVVAAQPSKYREVNPLLGAHPSHLEIDAFFAATTLAHVGISYLLPSPYRRVWQLTTVAVKAGFVGWNVHAGIQVALPW